MLRPDLFHHAGVDLAGEKAQRQADDTRAMGDHAFDGIMGLAGIGGAEHRGHAAAGENHGLHKVRFIAPRALRRPPHPLSPGG